MEEGRIKEIVSVRSLEGARNSNSEKKNRLFQQGELGLTDPSSLRIQFTKVHLLKAWPKEAGAHFEQWDSS